MGGYAPQELDEGSRTLVLKNDVICCISSSVMAVYGIVKQAFYDKFLTHAREQGLVCPISDSRAH